MTVSYSDSKVLQNKQVMDGNEYEVLWKYVQHNVKCLVKDTNSEDTKDFNKCEI